MKKGDGILRCQPFSYVVHQSCAADVCDGCLKERSPEAAAFKKCSACKVVYYCTVDCQRKSWTAHHRAECPYLKKAPKVPTDTVRLMSRIILKLLSGGGRDIAELPDGQKRHFDDLMCHRKEIIQDSARIDALNSFFDVLVAYLPDKMLQKSDVLDIYGRVLINSFNIMNNDYNAVGIGLYLAASVLDHSCWPNATVVFKGKTLIVNAIENVKSFSDVRISYTNLLESTEARRKNLMEQYYFHCECEKCVSPDSLRDDQEKSSLVCEHCQEGCVPLETESCIGCDETPSAKRVVDYKRILDVVKNKAGGHPEPEEHCSDYIDQMSKVFHEHDKTYLDCLEMVYENHVAKRNFRGALDMCEPILKHYRRFYPGADVNIALMELKTAKLAAYLNELDLAERHFEKAKDVLRVTHGVNHPIMLEVLPRIKQDIVMGRKELADINGIKKSG